MRAFLGYCGVVDHQHGIAAADQPIRLNKQFRLRRPRIPHPGRNEVVQLIVFAKPKPLRHRLNALTIARTDQPRHVEWTHLSPRLVTQPIQKRLEKASKLFFPIRRPATMVGPSKSRPPMSHRKTDLGIPCRSKSAKVVLRPTSRMLRPWTRSKKLRRACGGNPREACTRHIGRGLVSRRNAGGPKEQAHLSLGQERFTPPCRPRSTDPIDLSVWCGLSRTWSRRRPRAAGLQLRSHAAPSRRDRNQSRPPSARHYPP